MAAQTRLIYEFDDFHVEPDERRLLRRGEQIDLPGKAFDLLIALIRNRGKLLTKNEILELVWPNQIVEEANLTVNMSAIRRALGERANKPRYITTVSGHGYRFNGTVRQLVQEALTVERERFARLTVEQEEFDSEPANVTTAVATRASSLGALLRSNALLLNVGFGILVLAIAGASPWLYRSLNRRAIAPAFGTRPLSFSRFSTHGGAPFRVVISPDGKSLIYNQRINGKMSLWLGQIDSNSSVPICQREGLIYFALAYSPDGGSVYLTVRESDSTQSKLVRMPVVGGVMTELARDIDGAVTFSPDAQHLAFLRSNDATKESSIIIADAANGQNERTLSLRSRPQNFSSEGLSWSPDGKTIAVGAAIGNGRSELLAVSVADGKTSRIGNRDWGVLGKVVWAPDGSGVVALVKDVAITRRSQIWFVAYPSGEPRELTHELVNYWPETLSVSRDGTLALLRMHFTSDIWVGPSGDATQAKLVLQGVEPGYEGADGLAWTPGGRLLYTAYVGEGESILEMSSKGGELSQLTSNVGEAVDRQLAATADGRYIVFQSNRSGRMQIWRMNADGSNLKQLTFEGSNSQPAVSPDGQWIVYASEQDGNGSLRRISIEGGQPIQLGDKRSNAPEVSPDGQSIAYIESLASGYRLLVIPANGGEPSKAFKLPPIVYLARRLHWTPDGKALVYKDSANGLWRQRLDGSEREPVKGLENVPVYNFAFSLDGKSLAYTRGVDMREIVLLRNAK